MTFPIGGNIQAWDPSINWSDTLDYWEVVNPASNVVTINNMNDKNRIFEAQQRWKDTLVVARFPITVKDEKGNDIELDGGLHLQPLAPGDDREWLVSPTDYMNEIEPMAEHDAVLYWGNEPSGEVDPVAIDKLVEHTVEGIKIADERERNLCVLNWGVGHPYVINGETDTRFIPVIEAINAAKMKHYWGLHLYAPVDTIVALLALETLCNHLTIPMPTCIVTEFGFDAAYGGDPLNGYKTRPGITGEVLANFTIEKVRNVYRRLIEEGKLKAIIGFSDGGEPRWHNWNYAHDEGYKKRIKNASINGEIKLDIKKTTSTNPTIPKYYPSIAPTSLEYPAVYKIALLPSVPYRNLRALPNQNSDDVGDVYTDDLVRIWDSPREMDSLNRLYRWSEVVEGKDKGKKGWLLDGAGMNLLLAPLPVETTPVTPTTPTTPTPTQPPATEVPPTTEVPPVDNQPPVVLPPGCPETFNSTLTREQTAAFANIMRQIGRLLIEAADIISPLAPANPEGVSNVST